MYTHQVPWKCSYPLPTQSRPMSETATRKSTFPTSNKNLVSFPKENLSMERDSTEFLTKTNDFAFS